MNIDIKSILNKLGKIEYIQTSEGTILKTKTINAQKLLMILMPYLNNENIEAEVLNPNELLLKNYIIENNIDENIKEGQASADDLGEIPSTVIDDVEEENDVPINFVNTDIEDENIDINDENEDDDLGISEDAKTILLKILDNFGIDPENLFYNEDDILTLGIDLDSLDEDDLEWLEKIADSSDNVSYEIYTDEDGNEIIFLYFI